MHQYSEYLGVEINRDAYHMTDLCSDGLCVSSCIQASIQDVGVSVEEVPTYLLFYMILLSILYFKQKNIFCFRVNYINAHAASTLFGDLADVNAVEEGFRNTVVSGHYFGGVAGGLEAIAMVKAIQGTSMKVF
ncbi:hypothetical protein LXL04_027186 [Taraxacum kok-saghyz]